MKRLLSFSLDRSFKYAVTLVMVVFAAVSAITYHMTRHPDSSANDISKIIQELQSSYYNDYSRAVESLAELAPDNKREMIRALLHSDRNVRYGAVGALGQADMSPLQTVPALVFAMRDEDRWVRWKAALGLFEVAPHPTTTLAIPSLVRALADEHVAEIATMALGRIGSPAVPSLAIALESEDIRVRYWAAIALEKVGVDSEQVRSLLTKLLTDQDPYVKRVAAGALGSVERNLREILNALEADLTGKMKEKSAEERGNPRC